jgi:hypothetical protein
MLQHGHPEAGAQLLWGVLIQLEGHLLGRRKELREAAGKLRGRRRDEGRPSAEGKGSMPAGGPQAHRLPSPWRPRQQHTHLHIHRRIPLLLQERRNALLLYALLQLLKHPRNGAGPRRDAPRPVLQPCLGSGSGMGESTALAQVHTV